MIRINQGHQETAAMVKQEDSLLLVWRYDIQVILEKRGRMRRVCILVRNRRRSRLSFRGIRMAAGSVFPIRYRTMMGLCWGCCRFRAANLTSPTILPVIRIRLVPGRKRSRANPSRMRIVKTIVTKITRRQKTTQRERTSWKKGWPWQNARRKGGGLTRR